MAYYQRSKGHRLEIIIQSDLKIIVNYVGYTSLLSFSIYNQTQEHVHL